MKTLVFAVLLLSILFMSACGPSGVEKLVSDYEQTVGATKTNLSLKIKKVDKLGSLTIGDSIKIIKLLLTKILYPKETQVAKDLTFENCLSLANSYIDLNVTALRHGSPQYNSEELTKWFDKRIKILDLAKLDSIYSKRDTSTVLAYRFKCTYTINNPFLNGVKQELTKTYLVNTSLTGIIKSE